MKSLIAFLLALALPVLAQTSANQPEPLPEPQTAEDWERLGAQARDMRAQAKQMRAAAEKKNTEDQAACWKKFLVSSCLDEAKQELREAGYAAKNLEVEAGRFERRIKAHERDARAQRRRDEAPQRAAEAARRAENIRQQEEEALQRMAKKRAEKGLTPGRPE